MALIWGEMHNIDQNTDTKKRQLFSLQSKLTFNQDWYEHFPEENKQCLDTVHALASAYQYFFFYSTFLQCLLSPIPYSPSPFPSQLACFFFYSTDLKWVSLQRHHNENQCDPNRSKPLQCYVFTAVHKQRNCRVSVACLFIVRHFYTESSKNLFHVNIIQNPAIFDFSVQ